MVPAAVILVVITLVLGVAIMLGMRTWVAAESRTETRLHDPSTTTVRWEIPNGVDPAVVMGALAQAGFTSVIDQPSHGRCLRVECAPTQRARLREVIAGVHASAYDGADLAFGDIVFEDER